MTRRFALWVVAVALMLGAVGPAVASTVCDEDGARREAAQQRDRPISWDRAYLSRDGRTLLITVSSSILRLTKVVLRGRSRSVTVTVFQVQPQEGGVDIPDISVGRCLRVQLRRPLGKRRVVDGRSGRERRVRRRADAKGCSRIRTVRR